MTSSQTVLALRKKLSLRSIGHTGTLDRFAEGLLILPFGDYTSFSQIFLEEDKTYLAEIQVGRRTDSGDPEGSLVTSWDASELLAFQAKRESWENTIRSAVLGLSSWTKQEAPVISALKQGGVRHADLFRQGIQPERRERTVALSGIEFLGLKESRFAFRLQVSSGTYIRKLVLDLSDLLELPMMVTRLVRERIGCWQLSRAKTWREIELPRDRATWEEVLPEPSLVLTENQAKRVRHGGHPDLGKLAWGRNGFFLLAPESREILAWVKPSESSSSQPYRYQKVFFNPSLQNPVCKEKPF